MWRSASTQVGSPQNPKSPPRARRDDRVSFELRDEDVAAIRARTGNFRQPGQQLSAHNVLAAPQRSLPVSHDESTLAWEQWRANHPCILTHFESFAQLLAGKRLAVFLDYDGTLTPIVSNPDEAIMSEEMRTVVRNVALMFPTAIISGRGREKVESFVQLKELFYAGSHGMDIRGPSTSSAGQEQNECSTSLSSAAFQPAAHFRPIIDNLYEQLKDRLKDIPGSSVEHNTFCVSAHFRNCATERWQEVIDVVEEISSTCAEVRVTRGRKVLEIRPKVDWHKGTALVHLVEALGLRSKPDVVAIYIGDDHTDEDAFRTLEETRQGFGILVSTKVKPTGARYTMKDPGEVQEFLSKVVQWGRGDANGWHKVQCCVGWHASFPTAES